MKNDLTGTWKGKFTYQKGYKSFNGEVVDFEMRLVQNGLTFSGTSKDIEGFGSHPDEALISGEVKDSTIYFTKQYPTMHYLDKKGKKIIDKNQHGLSISYKGKYNGAMNKFEGEWTLKMRQYILGLIPKTYIGSGTWEISREENATNNK